MQAGGAEYKPACVRAVANFTKISKDLKLESKTFNPKQFLAELPKLSPKLQALLDKIEELDKDDLSEHGRTFKHLIFSDVKQGGAGAKIIASALAAKGFTLAYTPSHKLKSDAELLKTKKSNFILLPTTPVFGQPIGVGFKKQLLHKFNERPTNAYGDLVRFMILDGGSKEGIDIFAPRYLHVFEPQTTQANFRQVVGRGTRTCGSSELVFHPNEGWPLNVFVYDVAIPDTAKDALLTPEQQENRIDTLGKLYMDSAGIDLRLINLTDELERAAIVGAVDYELNRPVHQFKLEDDTQYFKIFEGGAAASSSLTQPKASDKPVKCGARTCGRVRANKNVPTSTPMLSIAAIAAGEKIPKVRDGEYVRNYYCKLLTSNTAYCKAVQEATKDPVEFIEKHADEIIYAIRKRHYRGLTQSQRSSFLRTVFSVIPRPTVLRKMRKQDQTDLVSPKSVTPNKGDASDSDSTPSSSATKSAKSTKSEDSAATSESQTMTPEETLDEVDKEMTHSPPPLHLTPTDRKQNFLKVRQYVRDNFEEFRWHKPKMESMCPYTGPELPLNRETAARSLTGGASKIMTLHPSQNFMKHYFTPENPTKGMLSIWSTGSGKASLGVGVASHFEKEGYQVLWVTRSSLKSDIYKNIFDLVAHEGIIEKMNAGLEIPADNADRMRLLSKAWSIRPMSYRQFSNMISGKSALYDQLVKINGKEDPLRKTILIIDEAHKLYGADDLSANERPDVKKLHQAIMKSYVISKQDSVRLLLMTATPINQEPFEMIKLLNLLRGPKEQIPTTYDEFAAQYKLDKHGRFSKRGKWEYLNDIAGHISVLDRSRDARQFAQPMFQFVNVPMSEPEEAEATELKEFNEALATIAEQILDIKAKEKEMKKAFTQEKKEITARCKGLKKEALKECKEEAESDIAALAKQYDKQVISLKHEAEALKQEKAKVKKELTKAKKSLKEDTSVYSIMKSRCMKAKPRAPRKEKPDTSS
jgi:hypothetical protein